jgi:hypothetical protein
MVTCSDNKIRELIAVKMLHTSILNITVVDLKILPLGNYAPISVPNPLFKTILELILWNGLHNCHRIISDVIKTPSSQYILCLREQKNVTGG